MGRQSIITQGSPTLFGTSFGFEPNPFFYASILSGQLIYKLLKEKPSVLGSFSISPSTQHCSAWALGIQSIFKVQIIQLYALCPFVTNSPINKLSTDFYLYNFGASVLVGS